MLWREELLKLRAWQAGFRQTAVEREAEGDEDAVRATKRMASRLGAVLEHADGDQDPGPEVMATLRGLLAELNARFGQPFGGL